MKPTSRHRPSSVSFRRIPFLVGIFLYFLVRLAFPPAVVGAHQVFHESEVKAVFLFNLTKFIVWPEEINDGAKTQFSIAILGTDPFGRNLDQVILSETVKGRRIGIRHYQKQEEVQWQEIDLLFIGGEMLDNLPDMRLAARRSGVLTVGDATGFCHAGGMVNLLTVDSRVKIEINLEEAKKSDFAVSSQLLRLAGIVTAGTEGEP